MAKMEKLGVLACILLWLQLMVIRQSERALTSSCHGCLVAKVFSGQVNLSKRSGEQVKWASILLCVSTSVWNKFTEGGIASN